MATLTSSEKEDRITVYDTNTPRWDTVQVETAEAETETDGVVEMITTQI